MSQGKYSRRLRNTTLLAFLLPIALALPASYLLRFAVPGADFWPIMIGGLLVVGTTLWAGLPWWRTMDDMQKHGHMISWYWGGIAGGLVALLWLIAAIGLRSPQAQGAVALFAGQSVGFLVFWGIWMWRQQRGAGE